MTDELGSPLSLLREEVALKDQLARLNAMKRVKMIGDVMGPEATRAELIPYLESIVDEDDEFDFHVVCEFYYRN